MYEALLVTFLLVAIGLVVMVLLQQGKGAEMGASFGSGASGTLFGSSGSGNFMTRLTGILAALFFIISLVLGNMSDRQGHKGSQWESLGQQTKPASTGTVPVTGTQTVPQPVKPNSDVPQ